jgi:Tfp pilus assembly protein PilN
LRVVRTDIANAGACCARANREIVVGRTDWLLSLSPSAVSVLSPDRTWTTISLDPREWEEAWVRGLHPFDGALERLVREAGIPPRAQVDLVFQSRDASAEVMTYDLRASESLAAARLAIADQFPGGTDGQPESAHVLLQEANPQRTHVLVCAERDETAQSLKSWLERGDLRLGRLVPARALGIAEAVRTLAALKEPGPAATVYLGAHFTCIAASRGAELSLVRAIDLGFDALVDAVSRATQSAGEGGRVVQARDEAREQLLTKGIPSRSRGGDTATGLNADRVLPLIQPVLQRYVVELRQTLRFALGETDMSRIRLVLLGLGAGIGGLAELLSGSMDVAAEAKPSCIRGELEAAVAHADLDIDLSPSSHAIGRSEQTIRRTLAIGVVAAALAIGSDAILTLKTISGLRDRIEENRAVVDAGRQYNEKLSRLSELSDRVARVEQALSEAVGRRADWAGFVQELSRLTSDRVRLTDFDGTFREARPMAMLKGVAFSQAQGDSQDPLRQFIGSLMNSPWANKVEIGSTRTAEAEGRTAVQFSLSAEVRRPTGSVTAAAGETGEQP